MVHPSSFWIALAAVFPLQCQSRALFSAGLGCAVGRFTRYSELDEKPISRLVLAGRRSSSDERNRAVQALRVLKLRWRRNGFQAHARYRSTLFLGQPGHSLREELINSPSLFRRNLRRIDDHCDRFAWPKIVLRSGYLGSQPKPV
jgi:hypothetical protein